MEISATRSIVRFDPLTESFHSFPSDRAGANVRQMDGRSGEAWGVAGVFEVAAELGLVWVAIFE